MASAAQRVAAPPPAAARAGPLRTPPLRHAATAAGWSGVGDRRQLLGAGRDRCGSCAAAAGRGGNLDALWEREGGFLHVLESHPGGVDASEEALWRTGRFAASVDPDLPVAMSWQGLLKHATAAPPPAAGGNGGGAEVNKSGFPPGAFRVATVAAQTRSREAVRERMLSLATGVDEGTTAGDGRPVQALLCLSGSHPARYLPWAERLLPASCLTTLEDATRMRAAGDLPPGLGLLCVDNPLLAAEGAPGAAAVADRLQRKIDAGAEAVLTQPPLLEGAYEAWWGELERRGIPSAARVCVGLPVIYNAFTLGLWLRLAGAAGFPESATLVELFVRPFRGEMERSHSKEAFEAWCVDWTDALAQKVQAETPGVAGVHVMPVTGKGRRVALQMISEGRLLY